MPLPGSAPIHPRWPERHRPATAWTEAWLVDEAGQDVVVEPYDGQGAYGEVYGPARTVRCLIDDRRRLVRESGGQRSGNATGDEVVSETTLQCSPDEHIPPESRVTLPDGRVTTVLTVSRMDGGTLPTPQYLELALA